MQLRPRSALSLVFVAASLCMGTAALAGTLSPGTLIPGPTGASVATQPQLAGSVVEDVTTPFRYTGSFTDSSDGTLRVTQGDVSGTVRSRVVLADDGTYDFYWQITVDAKTFLPVASLNLSGFAPATYRNADWRSDIAGDVPPAVVSEQTSGDVNWAFGQYIPPSTEIYAAQKSYFVFLDSDARYYSHRGSFSLRSERDSGGSMQIDWNGASGPYPTFAPSSVPETTASRQGAPAALAAAYLHGDAALKALPGRTRGCIVSKIAEQQGRYAAYGPKHGPYDANAVRAAVRSFADLCR